MPYERWLTVGFLRISLVWGAKEAYPWRDTVAEDVAAGWSVRAGRQPRWDALRRTSPLRSLAARRIRSSATAHRSARTRIGWCPAQPDIRAPDFYEKHSMKAQRESRPIHRYVTLDLHKEYVMVGVMNAAQE